jgi:hypothetical protein
VGTGGGGGACWYMLAPTPAPMPTFIPLLPYIEASGTEPAPEPEPPPVLGMPFMLLLAPMPIPMLPKLLMLLILPILPTVLLCMPAPPLAEGEGATAPAEKVLEVLFE